MTATRGLTLCAALLFLALAIGSLGYVGYVEMEARAYQAHARTLLTTRLARSTPPARREGDVLGEISSGRIGLRAVVVEGETADVLRHAVGHVADTPAPGESGNVVLAGHRDSYFRPLRNIRVGDEILVTADGRDAVYDVEWISVVSPDDLQVLEPTAAHTLTLITCYPFSFVGAAPSRFVVRALRRAPSETF